MQLNRSLKWFAVTATALTLVFGLTSCGDSHESIAEDQMDLMDELSDIIEDVKDEASAKKAAEKLNDLKDDFEALAERAKKLGEPSDEVKKELEEKYKAKQKEIIGKVFALAAKMQKYPELQKAMETVDFGN